MARIACTDCGAGDASGALHLGPSQLDPHNKHNPYRDLRQFLDRRHASMPLGPELGLLLLIFASGPGRDRLP
jgi:hypothetical protein